MVAPDRDLAHLDAERSGECPQRREDVPDRVRDDGGVPGHHHDRHGLADRTPDAEDDRGSDTGEGGRDETRLMVCQRVAPMASDPSLYSCGTETDGILRYADDRGERHDAEQHRGRKPGLPGREVERDPDEIRQDDETEEPVHHRGDPGQQLDGRLEDAFHPG